MVRFKRRNSIRGGYLHKVHKPVFVISAIRANQGGALEVINDFLSHIDQYFHDQFQFIALVYKKELYHTFVHIDVREFPKARKNFVYRLWMEYVGFLFLSKRIKPAVWLSMQDSSPNVEAERRYVYWQNALPQRGLRRKDLLKDRKLFFITLLYKHLYCRNLQLNNIIFLQQQGLKKFMSERFKIPASKIKVAPLRLNDCSLKKTEEFAASDKFVLLYPCYPYAYKNLETIINGAIRCKANNDIEIWLTADGSENRYAADLYRKSKSIDFIKWIGFKPQSEMNDLYKKADALLFMSECESWGIPINIFKQMEKPLLVADLPYAHETVGHYSKVKFIPVTDSVALFAEINSLVTGSIVFNKTAINEQGDILHNWDEVMHIIIKQNTGIIRYPIPMSSPVYGSNGLLKPIK